MVKVFNNDFGILINNSLEILTVYKLDYHLGPNIDVENCSEST